MCRLVNAPSCLGWELSSIPGCAGLAFRLDFDPGAATREMPSFFIFFIFLIFL
jgi:hypothetical protein